ncbi:MAG: Rrf2 family transcriptional regulator [Candidatus Zixiibacteriota bacterium]|nr:MAG: Rrf2 family transcriptional regulator [candidate division Zixibacteria bacterium]
MKITALEEYGLRCMVLLARQRDDDPLTLPEFATREGFSIPYAGKLLMILKRSGLVKAVRGRKGGYVLAQSPEEITLKEIFEVLGKPVFSAGYCGRYAREHEVCIHSGDCTVKNIWQTFDEFIESYLEQVTLADLASGDISPLEENGLKLQQKA